MVVIVCVQVSQVGAFLINLFYATTRRSANMQTLLFCPVSAAISVSSSFVVYELMRCLVLVWQHVGLLGDRRRKRVSLRYKWISSRNKLQHAVTVAVLMFILNTNFIFFPNKHFDLLEIALLTSRTQVYWNWKENVKKIVIFMCLWF